MIRPSGAMQAHTDIIHPPLGRGEVAVQGGLDRKTVGPFCVKPHKPVQKGTDHHGKDHHGGNGVAGQPPEGLAAGAGQDGGAFPG